VGQERVIAPRRVLDRYCSRSRKRADFSRASSSSLEKDARRQKSDGMSTNDWIATFLSRALGGSRHSPRLRYLQEYRILDNTNKIGCNPAQSETPDNANTVHDTSSHHLIFQSAQVRFSAISTSRRDRAASPQSPTRSPLSEQCSPRASQLPLF
jgi:hypothetical protein